MNSEDYETEREAKRRRLRKGTHSCWECKRRKVRCTFASATDTACITCRRRGARCVGQDEPEELGEIEDGASRMVRVETLLVQLMRTIEAQNGSGNGNVELTGVGEGGGRGCGAAADLDLDSAGFDSRDSAAFVDSASGSEATPFFVSSQSQSHEARSHEPRSRRDLPRGARNAHRHHQSRPAVEKRASVSASASVSVPTPSENRNDDNNKLSQGLLAVFNDKLSETLLAAFPDQKDIDILVKTCNWRIQLCHRVNDNRKNGAEYDEARQATISGLRIHPVLLAKNMLIFASLLMDFPAQQHICGLSEHHCVIMERLAETAIRLVTTNERLLGTAESLECILLEGLYLLNCGNIRQAWLAFRRAMTAAQLMGISRPNFPASSLRKLDPDTDLNPQTVWAYIVYMDRFLSLLLALPPGYQKLDSESTTVLATRSPRDRLEHIHSMIGAKIHERNQLDLRSKDALALTLEIDRDLRVAAQDLPAEFWRPPQLAAVVKSGNEKGAADTDTDEAYSETIRVRDHVTHFTLVNQLHLPYLLRAGPDAAGIASAKSKSDYQSEYEYQYATSSCVYACREILTRFIFFRTAYPISTCCRLADFVALVAGLTLILAHLDSYRHKNTDTPNPNPNPNLLTHQRLGDRATLEQALEKVGLKGPGHFTSGYSDQNILPANCAALLRHLLRIEGDVAQRESQSQRQSQGQHQHQHQSQDKSRRPRSEGNHNNDSNHNHNHHDDNDDHDNDDTSTAIFITTPYSGTIKIGPYGIKSVDKRTNTSTNPNTKTNHRSSSNQSTDLEADLTIGGIGSIYGIDRILALAKESEPGPGPGPESKSGSHGPACPQCHLCAAAQPQSENIYNANTNTNTTSSESDGDGDGDRDRDDGPTQPTNTTLTTNLGGADYPFTMQLHDDIDADTQLQLYPSISNVNTIPNVNSNGIGPGLGVGMDDWGFGFPSVDTAFFDRLI